MQNVASKSVLQSFFCVYFWHFYTFVLRASKLCVCCPYFINRDFTIANTETVAVEICNSSFLHLIIHFVHNVDALCLCQVVEPEVLIHILCTGFSAKSCFGSILNVNTGRPYMLFMSQPIISFTGLFGLLRINV